MLKQRLILAAPAALSMFLAIGLSGASAETWNSQLFPKHNGKFTIHTVTFAGRDWTLDEQTIRGGFRRFAERRTSFGQQRRRFCRGCNVFARLC